MRNQRTEAEMLQWVDPIRLALLDGEKRFSQPTRPFCSAHPLKAESAAILQIDRRLDLDRLERKVRARSRSSETALTVLWSAVISLLSSQTSHFCNELQSAVCGLKLAQPDSRSSKIH